MYVRRDEEQKTLPGITPEKRWLSLTLVFPKAPTIQKAYEAAIAEAEKAAPRGLDANVYVSVGDKAVARVGVSFKTPAVVTFSLNTTQTPKQSSDRPIP